MIKKIITNMENKKINIAELFKDCPKGMELDCTMIDNVVFEKLDVRSSHHPIIIRRTDSKDSNTTIHLTKYGQYSDEEDYKCVIYPKGKTTWEGFVPPCEFKDGDVVFSGVDLISIYKEQIGGHFGRLHSHVSLSNSNIFAIDGNIWTLEGIRFATEEEKQKLFNAIKANGYKWNAETKTLEKLPKFKIGDRVKKKDSNEDVVLITDIADNYYIVETKYGMEVTISISIQNDYELAPNKFDITTLKPFESRVLVRHNKDNKWCGSFFSHIDGVFHSHCYKFVTIAGKSYPMCIPYEGNEYLLGTTNDCKEYFKTW